MGVPEQWGRGFAGCLAFAFAYPVMTLVVAWGFRIDASIGDTYLFAPPEKVLLWQRELFLAGLVAIAFMLAPVVTERFSGLLGMIFYIIWR